MDEVSIPPERVAEVIAAFLKGTACAPTVTIDSSNGFYWKFLLECLKDHALATDIVRLSIVRRQLFYSLQAARQSKLSTASQHLAEASDCACGISAFAPSQTAQSTIDSAKAYWHYRRGEYEAARECLSRADQADVQIESRSGIFVIRLHRATLVSNSAYIDVREGRHEDSVKKLAALVRSFTMSPKSETLTYRDDALRRVVPRDLLEMSMKFVAGDFAAIAGTFGGEHVTEVVPLVENLVRDLTGAEDAAEILPTLKVLLEILSERALDLSRLITLLRTGPAAIPWLWYAVCMALALSCARGEAARDLTREVVGAAVRWPDAPPSIRAAVQQVAARMDVAVMCQRG